MRSVKRSIVEKIRCVNIILVKTGIDSKVGSYYPVIIQRNCKFSYAGLLGFNSRLEM